MCDFHFVDGLCFVVGRRTIVHMKIERKPFNVMLSAAERKALEALRVKRGLKSEGDVLRALIFKASEITQDAYDIAFNPSLEGAPAQPVLTRARPRGDPTPISPKAYEAKRKPIKSRLKGEWKAP